MALENSERERTTFDATCFDEESAPHNAAPPIAPPLADGALPMGEALTSAQAPPMSMPIYHPYNGGTWTAAPYVPGPFGLPPAFGWHASTNQLRGQPAPLLPGYVQPPRRQGSSKDVAGLGEKQSDGSMQA